MSSAYQVICTGVYKNIEQINGLTNPQEWILGKILNLYKEETYINNNLQGVKPIPRYQELSKWGEDYFRP